MNDKLRNVFEIWAGPEGYDLTIYDYVINRPYVEPTTQYAWESWMACYSFFCNNKNKQCVCNNANLD